MSNPLIFNDSKKITAKDIVKMSSRIVKMSVADWSATTW